MSLTARASLALISLSLLDACSSSSAADGTAVQADCGAIELRPALIVVEGAGGVTIACDATFTQLVPTDAGATTQNPLSAWLCTPMTPMNGCPPTTDGGTSPCAYLLNRIAPSPGRVEVSQPGYASTIVDGVFTGVGGCVPPTDASTAVVELSPSDAGRSDAGAD